ncbi:MAG TPA: YceI family protein [Bacteroidia bacterium]|nr:YceI family protein [Bacteroidia bacterium]
MKRIFGILTILVFSVALMSFSGTKKHSDVYSVDVSKSKLEWLGKKVTGQHNGIILLKSGTLSDNHGRMSGSFDVDMNSIEVLDLEGKMKEKLTNHLKSDDFFGVSSFPSANFIVKAIEPATENNRVLIRGELTIKGKTNPLDFEAALTRIDNVLSFSGVAIIDRSKYDVKYGSTSFFGDLGDKAIYDNFEVRFTIVASKTTSHPNKH